MLCSFRRIRSSYPLLLLTSNLTASELAVLRALDGPHEILDITNQALADRERWSAATRAGPRGKPHDCLIKARGGWMSWGRSDFEQTLLKRVLWSALEGIYDEVCFLDADSLLLSSPDALFDALRPLERPSTMPVPAAAASPSGRGRHLGRLWWHRSRGCAYPWMASAPGAHPRRFCPRMQFIASESARQAAATRFGGGGGGVDGPGGKEAQLLGLAQQRPASANRTDHGNRSPCDVPGWQSGFFLTRPSKAMAEALWLRAYSGNFSIFTNTEQDVIDAEWDPRTSCVERGAGAGAHGVCARQATLNVDVLRRFVWHHKLHAYTLAKDGGAHHAKGTRRKEILSTNRYLANLSVELCSSSSSSSSSSTGTRGAGAVRDRDVRGGYKGGASGGRSEGSFPRALELLGIPSVAPLILPLHGEFLGYARGVHEGRIPAVA
jgi:hypothetical protein